MTENHQRRTSRCELAKGHRPGVGHRFPPPTWARKSEGRVEGRGGDSTPPRIRPTASVPVVPEDLPGIVPRRKLLVDPEPEPDPQSATARAVQRGAGDTSLLECGSNPSLQGREQLTCGTDHTSCVAVGSRPLRVEMIAFRQNFL